MSRRKVIYTLERLRAIQERKREEAVQKLIGIGGDPEELGWHIHEIGIVLWHAQSDLRILNRKHRAIAEDKTILNKAIRLHRNKKKMQRLEGRICELSKTIQLLKAARAAYDE